MNKRASEYRLEAKTNCEEYKGVLIIIALITLIVNFVIGFTINEKVVVNGIELIESKQPLSFLALFLSGQLAIGWAAVSKNVYTNSELKVGTLFKGFKSNYFKWSWAHLLQSIYLVLWGIITLGIMAIVKSLSYSMTYYILEEHPDWSVNDAITESRKMMNGHKWKLFCLLLSYLGWLILSALTFGILSLWITPRIEQAKYLFYKDIKN